MILYMNDLHYKGIKLPLHPTMYLFLKTLDPV